MSLFAPKKQGTTLEQASYWVLIALTALLPFILIASRTTPMLSTKVLTASILAFVALFLFSFASIRRQEVAVPRVWLLGFAWLIPVAYALSAVFSKQGGGFFGERLQVDSFGFMLICALVLSLAAFLLHSRERVLGVFVAMLLSALVLTALELILFFWGSSMVQSGMYLTSVSLIGSLNDLAVFFGLIILFVLLTFILLPVAPAMRVALWLSLVASLFFLVTVNLTILWWVVGAAALIGFVYSVSVPYFSHKARISSHAAVATFTTLVLACAFLFGSDQFTSYMARTMNVGELDIRPSWSATVDIGRAVYHEHALFGSGPGTFSHLWAKYMPAEVNATPFWVTNFEYGIGIIPTSALTTGLFGLLMWAVFLGSFLWYGVRMFMRVRLSEQGNIEEYLRIVTFISALYLWAIAFIQVPSPVLLVYAFILTGMFIASHVFEQGERRATVISFSEKPRLGFLFTLALTFALLGSAAGVYSTSIRYLAERAYVQSSVALDAGDIDSADASIKRAIGYNPSDMYYGLASNLSMVRIQQLLAQGQAPDKVKDQFQQLLGQAIADATKASEIDPNDYQNWITLGGIYQNIVPLGIEGSANSANAAFDRALELRPNTPIVLVAKASIARAQGNNADAQKLVQQAITMRPQYTDAIFLLAQLQIDNNQVEEAKKSVAAAIMFDQQNPVAFFQLGLLSYSTQDFAGAIQVLTRAVELNAVYANARYFLGLSYLRLGDTAHALEQFKKVRETNADNVEVATLVSNLEQGKNPFASMATSTVNIAKQDGTPIREPKGSEDAMSNASSTVVSE